MKTLSIRIPDDMMSALQLVGKEEKIEPSTAMRKRLREAKIPAAIYYPRTLHLQTDFAFLGYEPAPFPSAKTLQTVSSVSPCTRTCR